jgi:toxin YoeB
MAYHLDFTDKAKEDIAFFKKTGNKAILNKLQSLLGELSDHPFTGTGKPEALKHNLSGLWSRRINQEHRLVYEVIGDTVVIIIAAKGHYE